MRTIEKRLERLEQAAKAARRVLRSFADFYPVFRDQRAQTEFYSANVPPAPPDGLETSDLTKYETGRRMRAEFNAKFYPHPEEGITP